MKFRSLFLVVFMMMTLLVAGVANAQDGMLDPCLGLSADDCAVINDASANGLNGAESFTMDLSIIFSAGNIPDESMSAVTFSQIGVMDVATNEASMIGSDIAGSFDVSFSQNDGDLEEQLIEFIIVDDILYFSMEGEWLSVDITRFLEDEGLQAQLEGFGLNPEDLMGADDGAMADDLPVDIEGLLPLLDVLNLPGFLNYERMGDDFVFTVDFSALQALLEEDNAELLNSIVSAAAEVEPTAAFIIPAIPTLINEGTIQITQTVDTGANIISAIGFDMNFAMALGALTTGDASAPATTVDLNVNIGLSNLDAVGAIEAPANATDITDDVLDGMGMALPAGQ